MSSEAHVPKFSDNINENPPVVHRWGSFRDNVYCMNCGHKQSPKNKDGPCKGKVKLTLRSSP